MAIPKEPVEKEVKHPAKQNALARASHTSLRRTPTSGAPQAHAARPVHPPAKERYTEAIGRRKTAVARVRIMAGHGKMTINDKDAKSYFALPRSLAAAIAPLKNLQLNDIDVTVKISGGGISAQAEAVRHGLARAIVLKNPEWKPRLRAMGYLTRDSRMVERKKYGLKKARRAPQWAKR